MAKKTAEVNNRMESFEKRRTHREFSGEDIEKILQERT